MGRVFKGDPNYMEFVVIRTETELRANVARFRREAEHQPTAVKRAILETNNWVCEPLSMSFAPTKFAAYSGISAVMYDKLRPELDAQIAKRTVERIVHWDHGFDTTKGTPIYYLLVRWIYLTCGEVTYSMESGYREYRFAVLSVPIGDSSV